MELTFLRGTSRLFNGTFDKPAVLDDNHIETTPAKPIYRVFTTTKYGFMPVRTTVTFIGSDNPEEHHEVAQILWNWPSQRRSYVFMKGRIYTLNEFLNPGSGIFSTVSQLKLGDEDFFWRTHDFEPQCYDSKDNQVVKYERKYLKNHPKRQGHLLIDEDIASHPDKLDAIFLSFWIFKICRDVHIPWSKKYVPKPTTGLPAKDESGSTPSSVDVSEKQADSEVKEVQSKPDSDSTAQPTPTDSAKDLELKSENTQPQSEAIPECSKQCSETCKCLAK